jgi:anti-sigma factor ChrR (cupin superfamily)
MIFNHSSDERLAEYSEGRLEEPELGEVEEHLLICELSRVRLTTFDDAWGLNGDGKG